MQNTSQPSDEPPHRIPRQSSIGNSLVKTDQLVLAQDVLGAILEIRRLGVSNLVQQMEACEPDLCEFFLEEATNIHSELSRLGLRSRRLRTLNERIQSFGLTLIRSLRCAQLRLWDEAEQGPTRLLAPTAPEIEPESEQGRNES